MGITYGDHLIDSGYHDITPEQEREIEGCQTCKGTGIVGWFDHAEGAWRNEVCAECFDGTCPVCGGDCSAANPPVMNCPLHATTTTPAIAPGSAEGLRKQPVCCSAYPDAHGGRPCSHQREHGWDSVCDICKQACASQPEQPDNFDFAALKKISRETVVGDIARSREQPEQPAFAADWVQCEQCYGTGLPGGKMGGPDSGICGYCMGTGKLTPNLAPAVEQPALAAVELERAEQLVRDARDVLSRLQMYAPDMGVDEFLDAIHDARLLIAKIDGAE